MARYVSVTYEQEELGDYHDLGCKCCRMRTGADLPIPSDLEIDEIAEEAEIFRVSIFRDWTRLNAILKRFEPNIQRRWMKKSAKQKREILLKARPELSATHRPDFESFRKISKQASRSKTCRTAAFLWPHLNVEDLQQRHLLLLFLNSRGRNLPDTHRIADVNLAHLGEGWDYHVDLSALGGYCCDEHLDMDPEIPQSCMLFQNKHSPTGYGKVLESEDVELLHPSQFPYVRDAKEGLLCLEIQAGTYSFLLACAKLILHDIKPSVLFFTAAHQPQPTMDQFAGPEYQSLAGHTLEAPYLVPQALDLERLKVLVSGRRSTAEDHIWDLQEDPGYFIDTHREWSEHSHHRPHKICNCKNCRSHIAARIFENAFISFVYWDDIYRKLCAMPSLDVQMTRVDDSRVQLSEGDCHRWAALMGVVWQLLLLPLSLLKDGLPNSPRMRNRYEWSEAVGEREGDWILRSRSTDAEVRVHTLFTAIFKSQETWYKTVPGLVEEVQYMIDTDPEASQYVDEWILNHFSDLALLCELGKSINLLAPYFDHTTAEILILDNTYEGKRDKVAVSAKKLKEGIREACSTSLGWNPLDKTGKVYEYPSEKRRSKANVQKMREAERELDKFWKRFETAVKVEQGISLKKVLERRLLNKTPRLKVRTPPWKEEASVSPLAEELPSTEILGETDGNIPRSGKAFLLDLADKVKTRGVGAGVHHHPATGRAEDAPPPEPETILPKVKLGKKAYKIWLTLLPSAASAQHPRPELGWDEFLFGFRMIGLEPEKLYGSVWQFSPVKDRALFPIHRSIQFHEPKEVRKGGKIPKPMVRTFGRRLRHAYGWVCAEDMFELE